MRVLRSSGARRTLGTILLFAVFGGAALGIRAWKQHNDVQATAAAAGQAQEPAETAAGAPARTIAWARTTTAIGTVRALQSITLRNELPGTVRTVNLATGQVVEKGALLVELDVAVETAQLAALAAQARLAETMLGRMERALQSQGASAADVDRARAERDMAEADVARLQAVIEQKRLRAPFRARTGLVDLHPGQYLQPGTAITTLQGIADAVHVDFAVPQETAARLGEGAAIGIVPMGGQAPVAATIAAIDAQVDEATRNAWVRALLRGEDLPRPGASVRVEVPLEAARDVVVVPVSALRRGPGGEEVFVLAKDPQGRLRAHQRRVRAGAVLGDEVVILDGLQPGETVAAAGSFKLREGVLVHVPAESPKGN